MGDFSWLNNIMCLGECLRCKHITNALNAIYNEIDFPNILCLSNTCCYIILLHNSAD